MERSAASAWPAPTGIGNNHRDVAQVGSVPHRRLDANPPGDARDGERIDATIAQGNIQRRTFKRRHGDLVKDRLEWEVG